MLRTIQRLQARMREIRHDRIEDQARWINQLLQGHYAYFGMAGNWWSLYQVYRVVARFFRRMLSRRSQKSLVTWEAFQRILQRFPLRRPRNCMFPTPLCSNTPFCESIFEEPSAGNPHAGFRGGRVARGGQPFHPELQEIGQGGVLRHCQSKEAANGATVHLNYGACSLLDIQDNHVRQPVLWGYGQDFLVCSFGGGGGGKTCALLACSPQLPASVELWFDSSLRQF
ncbi:MAG: hypothetical protein M1415_11370 [Firmicutes bacterium]|nr:hypothetical protein [Bacillota bacterium]